VSDLLKRILQQNWPFYSHRQLYDMVRTEAAGAGVLSDAERAWSEFAALMTDSRARIDELLREAGASWEGIAAESMAQGVTPLAQWADDAGAAGQASGSGLRQVGDSFSYTANAMPEPVRVTVTARYANVFSGQIDQDRQDRLAQEAKLRAVELMQRYSTDAHSAVSGLGVFVPPQEVTVRATPLQPPGGTAVQHGGNQIVTAAPGGARLRRETATQPDPGPASDESPAPDETPTAHSGGTLAPTTETATAGPGPVTTSSGAAAPTAPAASVASVVPVGSNQRTTGGFPTGTGNSTGSRAARPEDRLPGRPAPRPGVGPVDGGRHDAGAARTQGARIAARTGAIGTGPTLAPAAATRREEDEEHVSPEYLRTVHKFWDVTPPASPPVIGDEDGAPPQAAPGS
jgi:hypothetical protein